MYRIEMDDLSDFGRKLCGESGILTLMDDIGKPLPKNVKPYRLGGGNPAQIPEVSEMYRTQMEEILRQKGGFESLIGFYDAPQGRMSFINTVAEYFSKKYGWKIGPQNIAVCNGSQSACFYLFNLLSGSYTKDGKKSIKKIVFPLAPEYIGYADQGIENGTFVSVPALFEETGENSFKYHIDFSALETYLEKEENVGAMCVTRPTNPTGNVLTDDEVKRLSSLAQKYGIPLVIDNAYGLPWPNIIFTDDATPYWDENVILSMSLSKIGLPTVRTGIIIASEQIIKYIGNLNAIAALASGSIGQALAEPLIKSGKLIETAKNIVQPFYRKKSEFALDCFKESFSGTNYKVHESEGSIFQWLLLEDLKISSKEFYAELKKRGVVVVPGEYFFFGSDENGILPPVENHPHYKKCLRINYASSEDEVSGGIKIISEVYRKFSV